MRNRLVLYYSLLVPGFLLFIFGPSIAQVVFAIFFLLATVRLPLDEDFLRDSLWDFPSFALLLMVVAALVLASFDIVAFLTRLNQYASLLVAFPLYLCFKLLTLPWTFLEEGLSAPFLSFKLPNRDSWLVLAGVSALAITYHSLPFFVFFLGAPVSFYLANNLGLSPA